MTPTVAAILAMKFQNTHCLKSICGTLKTITDVHIASHQLQREVGLHGRLTPMRANGAGRGQKVSKGGLRLSQKNSSTHLFC